MAASCAGNPAVPLPVPGDRFLTQLGACVQWRWARAHERVDITGEGGALATSKGGYSWRPAVCGEVLQAEGDAYAEFTLVSGDNVMVGVVRAGVDPSSVRGGRALCGTADAWMYYSGGGAHCHNGSRPPWASGSKQGIEKGGTVGLLLRRGSLSVHIGGRRVGVMCTGLTGPLVWAADLYGGTASSVRIARKPPPAA